MKKPCLFSSFLSGQVFFLLLFFSISIYGQIQYTDVTPDKNILDHRNIDLDIDGDAVTDCSLILRWTTKYFDNLFEYFIVTDSLVEVAVINDTASALYVNETIDQNLIWGKADSTYLLYEWFHYYHNGQWYYVTDHAFLGLRIKKGDDFIYAWIRINVIYEYWHGVRSMFISDFAVNTNPNENIMAGQGIPFYATSVFGYDGNDYLDARDVSVSFTRAYDESLFSEYRIIMAKAEDTTVFDLDVLNQVPEDSYTKVLIDLEDSIHNVSLNIDQNKLDKDGDTIKSYLDYKVCLLNVSVSKDPSNNLVSTPSAPFYLSSISEPVSQLMGYDDDNSGTSSDIKVEFEKLSREEFIHEYRIFIAPYEETLNLEMALGLSTEHYTIHKPNNSNPVIEINPFQSDINGNNIAENVDYVVYILSVADGTYSKTSAISKPSIRFRLSNPDILRAGQIVGNNLVYVKIDTTLYLEYNNNYLDTLLFDIDQNGTMDIKFIGKYNGSPTGYDYRYLHVVGLGNTTIMLCDHINHPGWTAMLYENYQIGEQFNFSNENTILHEHVWGNWNGNNYSIGHFDPFNVAYVGFCLMDYNQPVYGWIRITRDYYYGGYLFDGYAYEIDASSIEDNKSKSSVILYPNPAHDFIYLETLNSYSSGDDIQVKIFDVRGNTIDEFSFIGLSHKHNISGYPKGIYFFELKIQNQMNEIHKIVVR